MAIEPATISASPAVTTMPVDATAPVSPAASAKGTVKPSDIPMTMSRTAAVDVKCFSRWAVVGIVAPLVCRVNCVLYAAAAGGGGIIMAQERNLGGRNDRSSRNRAGCSVSSAAAALFVRRARTVHRREDHGNSPRQAPWRVRHQLK